MFSLQRLKGLTKKEEIPDIKTVLRPYQKNIEKIFDEGLYKFILICWARRMGKDILTFSIACREAVKKPNQIIYYVFNTMKQGKMQILEGMTTDGKRIITEVVSEKFILKTKTGKLYHSDNTLRFTNGSIIYFVDAQDADSKVGGNLNLLVLSELATYKRQDILEYLIPSTLKVGGRILGVSTPRYGSRFNEMMLEDNPNRFKSIITAVSDEAVDSNGIPIYSIEELEYAKTQMSKEKFQQEYMCDMNTANESSIYSESIKMAKMIPMGDIKDKKVFVSMDLGFNDGQSLVFSYMEGTKVKPFHWYYTNNQPTKHYVDYINNILNSFGVERKNVELILPHDGNNRMDGYSNLTSRAEMYRQAGFKVNIVKAIKQLQGIEICRASIQNGDVEFIDNVVINNMLAKLKAYEWKTVNGTITYTPEHGVGLSSSNVADSLEYLTIYLYRNKYIDNAYKGGVTPKLNSMFTRG